jgi:hypothetical protein
MRRKASASRSAATEVSLAISGWLLPVVVPAAGVNITAEERKVGRKTRLERTKPKDGQKGCDGLESFFSSHD